MRHKKNIVYGICFSIAVTAFLGCEGMATLFHGQEPEEEKPVYTVAFDANGAAGTVPAPKTAVSGTAITLPGEGGLTNGSNVFTGWNVSKSGGGTTYPPESRYTVTADQTFYAQWTDPARVYTVTYNANGAGGALPSPQKVVQNGSITVADKGTLANGNKTFTGWNTAADGTGTGYGAGAAFTVNADTTFYAQWAVTVGSPVGLNVTGQTADSISLSWSAVSGATGYKVYKGSNSGDVTEYVAETSSASYIVTGLAVNTSYYFAVSAVNQSGESPPSPAVPGTTSAVTLGTPAGLRVTAQKQTEITLSWQAVSGATGYRVSRSADGNSYGSPQTTASTTYTDTGLTPAATYYYKVTAYSGQNESDAATVSGTTVSDGGTIDPPPPAPTGLVVTGAASGSVNLSWNGAANAASYDIYRSNTKDGTAAKIGTVMGTSYTDSAASAGAMYYYSVRAVNSSGSSPDSNRAFAVTASHYPLPTYSSSQLTNLSAGSKHYYRLAVTAGQGITITWEDGSSKNTDGDLRVSVWQNDGTVVFNDNGWYARGGYDNPLVFSAATTGYVTVEVRNGHSSNSYNYKIYY